VSELPTCPNVSQGVCARSDIVLAGESDKFWNLICRTCHLFWSLSKPNTKNKARYENELKRLAHATDADRKASGAPKTFTAPRGGWTT
jgi:hypothetical protein